MTAEISVLNRIGIALGADSAVTVGPGARKIYTSAEKLFQLSDTEPVGIMVYGNASLIGVPWETIIKVYRNKNPGAKFSTLKEYVDHFVRFVHSNNKLFPPSEQRTHVESSCTHLYSYVLQRFEHTAHEEMEKKGTLSEAELDKILRKVSRDLIKTFTQARKFESLPAEWGKTLRKRYGKQFKNAKKTVFEKFPFSGSTSRALTDVYIAYLTYNGVDGPIDTGVVIAGFGEDEHFPTLIELDFRGYALNRPIFQTKKTVKVGDPSDAYIVPFAQKEMVMTFMTGANPDLMDDIHVSTQNLFEGTFEFILEEIKKKHPKLGDSLKKNFGSILNNTIQSLFRSWQESIDMEYSQPIMSIVSSLPKEELAAIAESLINLTKFKRQISDQAETVAGPIDVAVITKGDGFIWVKRKYYFDAQLNPRHMSKYYRD